MRIATWNINSVRLRIEQVLKFVQDQKINLLCLQETKTEDKFFPEDEFSKLGCLINISEVKSHIMELR